MKQIVSLVAAALLGSAAMAQSKNPETYSPQYFADLRVQNYAKAIGLDPQQVQDLGAVFTKAEEAAAEQRKAAREAHQKAAAIMAQADLDIRSKLTKTQAMALDSLLGRGLFMPEVKSGVILEGGCPRGYDKFGCAVPPKAKTKAVRTPLKEGYPEISPVQH